MNKNQYPSSVDGAPWWGPTKLLSLSLSLSLSLTHTHTSVYEILIQFCICFSVAVQTVLKEFHFGICMFLQQWVHVFCMLLGFIYAYDCKYCENSAKFVLFQYVVLHNFIHIGRYLLSTMLCWSYLLRISINLSTCVCYQKASC